MKQYKVNVLLDKDTFDMFTAIARAQDKTPTKILKPIIKEYCANYSDTAKAMLQEQLKIFGVVIDNSTGSNCDVSDITTDTTVQNLINNLAENHGTKADNGDTVIVISKDIRDTLRAAGQDPKLICAEKSPYTRKLKINGAQKNCLIVTDKP